MDAVQSIADTFRDALAAGRIVGLGVALALVAWLIVWGIRGRIGAR